MLAPRCCASRETETEGENGWAQYGDSIAAARGLRGLIAVRIPGGSGLIRGLPGKLAVGWMAFRVSSAGPLSLV